MSKILISPSILSGNFAYLGESVKKVKEWGANLIHCDVMDGVYVTNLTFGMPMIAALKKEAELPLDVHLMITKPERYVGRFIEAGADYLTFHPEASENPLETLKEIRAKGVKAGIAFNPNVPFAPYSELLKECDLVLVMSVYAGYGGQSFIEESLNKVKEIKEYIKAYSLDIPIEIDGGVNTENAQRIIDAGVSILVAGSAVFKSKTPSETIVKLRGN